MGARLGSTKILVYPQIPCMVLILGSSLKFERGNEREGISNSPKKREKGNEKDTFLARFEFDESFKS